MGLIAFPIAAEVGFSSSGAGALGTVALLGLTSLSAAQVVGTDLTFGLVLSLVGTGIHMIGGSYDSSLLWQLGIGGIFGANIQRRLAAHSQPSATFCTVALASGDRFPICLPGRPPHRKITIKGKLASFMG